MSRNKYNAVRTECSCGTTHDSQAEAAYCQELQMKEKAGEIGSFLSHPASITLVAQRPLAIGNPKPITWKLDFAVWPKAGTDYTGTYYVDVKGCLYKSRTKMRGYRETQMKIRLWQLMGIPWPLHIVYTDRVVVYGGDE